MRITAFALGLAALFAAPAPRQRPADDRAVLRAAVAAGFLQLERHAAFGFLRDPAAGPGELPSLRQSRRAGRLGPGLRQPPTPARNWARCAGSRPETSISPTRWREARHDSSMWRSTAPAAGQAPSWPTRARAETTAGGAAPAGLRPSPPGYFRPEKTQGEAPLRERAPRTRGPAHPRRPRAPSPRCRSR